MDAAHWNRVRDCFDRAVELDERSRASFLERACGEDVALRREVEAMLASDSASSLFLSAPAGARPRPEAELAEQRIGGFRIARLIAAGGMGSVYEAEQDRPRRRVALKVLQPAFASPEGLARFRREVEVLGRLAHPAIARLYEAGLFEQRGVLGETVLPWFAMELVEGARGLVRFAREERLSDRERIDLFREVCAAVQHGHRHGVIHRDLKPSNVLVGSDRRPRVIDFGIALAVDEVEGETATADARRTRAGELLGTLRHMSPEQLSGDPRAVDTRSDVYALGVLLYELLCGRSPVELEGLALPDALRVLREDPPLAPRRARADLDRELGWILERALRKDPDERYGSVSALVLDLERHARGEPLEAGPASSAFYRARKFVARHRVAVLAGVTIALLLVGTLLGTVFALGERERLLSQSEERRRRAERESEKLAAVNDVVTRMLDQANPWKTNAEDVRLVDVLGDWSASLDRLAASEPEVEGAVRGTLGSAFLGLGRYEEAEHEARIALERSAALERGHPQRLRAQRLLVQLALRRGDPASAERLSLEAHEDAQLAFAEGRCEPGAALACLRLRAEILIDRGRTAEAETLLRAALGEVRAGRLEAAALTVLACATDLATVLLVQRRPVEAEQVAREALEGALPVLGETPATMTTLLQLKLGVSLLDQRRVAEAETVLAAARDDARARLGADHPTTADVLFSWASLRMEQGAAAEAEEVFRGLAELQERHAGGPSGQSLRSRYNLALALQRGGRLADCAAELRASLPDLRSIAGLGGRDTRLALSALCYAELSLGNAEAAALAALELCQSGEAVARAEDAVIFAYLVDLLPALGELGRSEEAADALERTSRILVGLQGPRSAVAARARSLLARLCAERGEHERACELAAEAADLLAEELGPEHAHALQAASLLEELLGG